MCIGHSCQLRSKYGANNSPCLISKIDVVRMIDLGDQFLIQMLHSGYLSHNRKLLRNESLSLETKFDETVQ